MLSFSAVVREAMPILATIKVSPRGPRSSASVSSVMATARSSSAAAEVGNDREDGGLRVEDGEEAVISGEVRASVLFGEADRLATAMRCQTPSAARANRTARIAAK